MGANPAGAAMLGTLLGAACSQGSSSAQTRLESPPPPATRPDTGSERDLAAYARAHGVSVQEARRRMAQRNRLDPGHLQARLTQAEKATFAGLWVEHRPTYRVVVRFTRDPAGTLRKYTTDPLFVPQLASISLAELGAVRDRTFKDLWALGLQAEGGADIKAGRIYVHVGDPERVGAAVRGGRLELSPLVDLIEPRPLPFAEPSPPPAGVPRPVKAFPRRRDRTGSQLASLNTGVVELIDGCLRMRDGARRPRVVVWPNEAALDLSSQPGVVRVLYRSTGDSIRAGEKVAFTGPFFDLKSSDQLVAPTPACPGPYVVVGSFKSWADFEEEMVPREARELAAIERLPYEEAVRRVRERKARGEPRPMPPPPPRR